MNCPKCGKKLHPMTLEGVDFDYCTACKGMWFDKDEMAAMADLPADIPKPGDVKGTAVWTKLPCPRCLTVLKEMNLVADDDLRIDHCPRCQGIWLDKGELKRVEKIAARIEDPRSRVMRVCKELEKNGYTVLGR